MRPSKRSISSVLAVRPVLTEDFVEAPDPSLLLTLAPVFLELVGLGPSGVCGLVSSIGPSLGAGLGSRISGMLVAPWLFLLSNGSYECLSRNGARLRRDHHESDRRTGVEEELAPNTVVVDRGDTGELTLEVRDRGPRLLPEVAPAEYAV